MLSKLDQNQGRQMEGKALIIKNKLGKRQMIVHSGTKKFFLSFFSITMSVHQASMKVFTVTMKGSSEAVGEV